MINVRALKIQQQPYPLIRQTPGSSGIWKEVQFHFDDKAPPYDYDVLLNGVSARTKVQCRPDNIWAVIQEPPADRIAYYHRGNSKCCRIYTTDPASVSPATAISTVPWTGISDRATINSPRSRCRPR